MDEYTRSTKSFILFRRSSDIVLIGYVDVDDHNGLAGDAVVRRLDGPATGNMALVDPSLAGLPLQVWHSGVLE